MRKGLIITVILLMSSVSFSYGQYVFGVSPGIGLNTAYVGYNVDNRFVPFFGLQYLNARFKYEESGFESDEMTVSGSLLIPNIGLKYYVKQQNSLQAYLSLTLSKPILSGKMEYDGVEDKDFNDEIKKISMWGSEIGFGVEYFFDENFSLGGEFGLRYIHLKYDDSFRDEQYNPETDDYEVVNVENVYKLNISTTFSKISLNFYF